MASQECSASSLALAMAALVMGCVEPQADSNLADPATAFTVRDSGDIEIVENHAPEHPPGQFWTIDAEPEIVLGGSRTDTPNGEPGTPASDSAQLIWQVRGLARLEDGRIAVLSQGNYQLFLFEPSGELSTVIGGRGEGPGEFARPQQLQYLPPDTLVVWDYWFAPTSYFNTGGRLLGERTIDLLRMMDAIPGSNAESTMFPLPDGSLIVVVGNPFPSETPAESFVRGPPAEFVRIDDSYSTRSLGSWEGLEVWVPQDPGGVPGLPTLMLDSYLAAGGNQPTVYISNGDRDEIHQFSLDGDLTRIIRRTIGPVRVTEAAQEAWETAYVAFWSWLGDLEEELGMSTDRFFAGMPLRDAFPPVAGLVVDAEGHLWVREWSASEAGMPDQWSVFGPDGRWLGVLPALPDLMLCHWFLGPCWIDRDFLLAVRRDELGIERVEGYRIRRGDEWR
ncbi:MAG: 6-bladed beta-propeller [Gemmatimonadetes bacterium]|nr:6-bladed beta-propeller [Gemmatimonadota bacterium]